MTTTSQTPLSLASVSPAALVRLRAQFERALSDARSAREGQLDSLGLDGGDHVVRAQREALTQVLTDIALAGQRLDAGTFGTCTDCAGPIPLERLQVRPWSATCVACARP